MSPLGTITNIHSINHSAAKPQRFYSFNKKNQAYCTFHLPLSHQGILLFCWNSQKNQWIPFSLNILLLLKSSIHLIKQVHEPEDKAARGTCILKRRGFQLSDGMHLSSLCAPIHSILLGHLTWIIPAFLFAHSLQLVVHRLQCHPD